MEVDSLIRVCLLCIGVLFFLATLVDIAKQVLPSKSLLCIMIIAVSFSLITAFLQTELSSVDVPVLHPSRTMEPLHPSGIMDPHHPNTTMDPPPYNPSFDQLEIGREAASTGAEALNEACKEVLDYLST
ncbi:hypothetical protein V8B97DRAFT_1920981 [Scleroderma yunnanense]